MNNLKSFQDADQFLVWREEYGAKLLAVCLCVILLFSSFQVGFDGLLNRIISKDLTKESDTVQKAYAVSSLPGTHLVSQIELLDYYPILSTSFVEVPGTQFNLNPSFYDGKTTFFFEAVMQSFSSGNTVTAKLLDKTSNSVVSNSILSTSSTSPVRLKSPALTLPSSSDEYAIQVSTSSNSGLLLSGRIIVSQNGATNTSVVIPIGNVAVSLSGQPNGNSPMFTSSTSPTLVRQIAKIYHFNQTKFDGKLNVFFESVISTNKLSRTASAYVFDLTANSTVAGSQVSTSNLIPTRVRSGNLTLANGHDYTFAISSSSTDAIATSFASRILVTQNNFTATEIPIRVANIFASTGANIVNVTTSISSINASAFTSPRFSFEADLFTSNSTLPASADLFDVTKNSMISSSTVTSGNIISTRTKVDNISLSQMAHEYIAQLKGSGNLVTVNNAWVLISMNLINRYTDIVTELGAISDIAHESVVTDYLNKTINSLEANTTSLVSDSTTRSTLLSALNNALQNVQSSGNSVSALDKINSNMSINNARSSITNYINQVSSFNGTTITTTTANTLVFEAQQILTDTHRQGTNIVALLKNNPLIVTGSIISKAKTDGTNLHQITSSLISLGFKVTLNAVHHSPTVTDILFSNAATLQSFDIIIPYNALYTDMALGISDEIASVGNVVGIAPFAAIINAAPVMVNSTLNSQNATQAIRLAVSIACRSMFTIQQCQFGFANPNNQQSQFLMSSGVILAIGSRGGEPGLAVAGGTILLYCFLSGFCEAGLAELETAIAGLTADLLGIATPSVTVVKVVNGGTLNASAFMIHINNPAAPQDFRGVPPPGIEKKVVIGNYNITENLVSGYTPSYNATCNGTISSLGQHKTCTITNTFSGPPPTTTIIHNNSQNTNGNPVGYVWAEKFSNIPAGSTVTNIAVKGNSAFASDIFVKLYADDGVNHHYGTATHNNNALVQLDPCTSGQMCAQKFTGLPAGKLINAIYVQSQTGTFGNSISIQVAVYQDDGPTGLPNTLLATSGVPIIFNGGIMKIGIGPVTIPASGNIWAAWDDNLGTSINHPSLYYSNSTSIEVTGTNSGSCCIGFPSTFGTATSDNQHSWWMQVAYNDYDITGAPSTLLAQNENSFIVGPIQNVTINAQVPSDGNIWATWEEPASSTSWLFNNTLNDPNSVLVGHTFGSGPSPFGVVSNSSKNFWMAITYKAP